MHPQECILCPNPGTSWLDHGTIPSTNELMFIAATPGDIHLLYTWQKPMKATNNFCRPTSNTWLRSWPSIFPAMASSCPFLMPWAYTMKFWLACNSSEIEYQQWIWPTPCWPLTTTETRTAVISKEFVLLSIRV
jgi:hypothetical protein